MERLRHHPVASPAAALEALELPPTEITAQLRVAPVRLPWLAADPAETQIQPQELQRMARLPFPVPAAAAVVPDLLVLESSAETVLPARLF
jgi:hypothetical protein